MREREKYGTKDQEEIETPGEINTFIMIDSTHTEGRGWITCRGQDGKWLSKLIMITLANDQFDA